MTPRPITPLPVRVTLPEMLPVPASVPAVPTLTVLDASEPFTVSVPPLTLVAPDRCSRPESQDCRPRLGQRIAAAAADRSADRQLRSRHVDAAAAVPNDTAFVSTAVPPVNCRIALLASATCPLPKLLLAAMLSVPPLIAVTP